MRSRYSLFAIGIAVVIALLALTVRRERRAGIQARLQERLSLARVEYVIYEANFMAHIRSCIATNLDDIFALWTTEVGAKDGGVEALLKAVKTSEVPNLTVGNALSAHRATIERMVFDGVNSNLIRHADQVLGRSGLDKWMVSALREWSNRDTKSAISKVCVSSLISNADLLGASTKAYLRRDQEPARWNRDNEASNPEQNVRLKVLRQLDECISEGLNSAQDDVLAIIRRDYLKETARLSKLR